MARVIIVGYKRQPSGRSEAAEVASHAVAALLLSHSIRRDVVFIAYFHEDESQLVLRGDSLRNLRADEESASGLIWSLIRRGALQTGGPRPRPGSCAVPGGGGNAFCGDWNILCRSLRSPIYIDAGAGYPLACSLYASLPETPTPYHSIVLVNMVMDWCVKNNS